MMGRVRYSMHELIHQLSRIIVYFLDTKLLVAQNMFTYELDSRSPSVVSSYPFLEPVPAEINVDNVAEVLIGNLPG